MVHGYFAIGSGPNPPKAEEWSSLRLVRFAFERFAEACDRYGQSEPYGVLYRGPATGDEETLGYPDYPDWLIERGPRGGIRITRA